MKRLIFMVDYDVIADFNLNSLLGWLNRSQLCKNGDLGQHQVYVFPRVKSLVSMLNQSRDFN